MQRKDAWSPQWAREGNGPPALRFDGADDCAILPSRSMPYGPFTLELNVLPEQAGRGMTLFSDACGVSLKLLADGHLRLARRKDEVVSQRTLSMLGWTRLAAIYDGERLKLYVDGVLDAEAPAEAQLLRINSLPVIGNSDAFSEGFKGLLGGFHLQCGVLTPERFALCARTPPPNTAPH
jgi:hypothetical protein